ncbi:MAG TPA: MgtC/SapB family protein [Polyangiales bacterium]|nr:MgtC/SapB family protein [Polyangiales bacterium]
MDASVTWQLEVLAEVALAILLGGCIGFEREVAEKPAGLRTHMMMAAAATLLVALSDLMLEHFGRENGSGLVTADPMRIVGAVVTSASILAAGTIFRRPEAGAVEGLTTAASLLLTSVIGIAVALRQFVLSVAVVVMVVLILRGVGWMQERITRRRQRLSAEAAVARSS